MKNELEFDNVVIKSVEHANILGIEFDKRLDWKKTY